ncbi:MULTISPECIES: HigA family addiction module antitoxin [Leptospira]|uniref:HigA family addiction module antitoxin n=1 Tax=Leptospira TaxID=171 RepID=UPI001EE8B842|nr:MULTISPECIES: HigA family addiction module antitoxin [Leptospira]MCG6162092.1 HigA family addiction module antidote protein [Leptospira bandrabouensis]MCG6170108.1 HigA family addiction module antitoxin [Leptospira sanjuanensis]MCG6195447.1 HigA family addiction module antitoxin [Leptospira sanjuanensis]
MKTKRIPTPTVSQILREEFLDPLEVTPYRLAKELHVSTSTVLEILHDKRKITIDMSLRLAKFFGMSDKFWINLQNDLEIRKQKEKLKLKLDNIQTLQRTG